MIEAVSEGEICGLFDSEEFQPRKTRKDAKFEQPQRGGNK
jgi:hypothetical protein